MTTKKSSVRVWSEYAIAQALVVVLCYFPLPLANAFARLTTRLLDLVIPKLRRIALLNLSFAFPELSTAERHDIVNGVFRSIARLLVAFSRFPLINAQNVHDWIEYEGLEHYLDAKQNKNGVLIATAHYGNWELSAFAHACMTEPMYVMVRPLDNPLINRLVEGRRMLSGNHLIDKRTAARSVINALRNNQAVGILIDQNTSIGEGVFIDFFGKLACVSSAFTKLAYHSQSVIVPGFAIWEEGRKKYVLRFYPQVPLTGDLLTDTQAIHSTLEGIIREHPEQWLWIHRRWKTRPAGESSLY